MMKVALWGSYGQGNFGDDLMAAVFGRHLIARGCDVLVFALDPLEASSFGLKVTSDIDELLDGSSLLVLGGGALLKDAQLIRSILKKDARKIELSYISLRSGAAKSGLPILPLSIGSDGASSRKAVGFLRRRLFDLPTMSHATVRLARDISLLGEFGVTAKFIPDILFATPMLLNMPKVQKDGDAPKRILINLHRKYQQVAINAISAIRKVYPNAQIIVTNSHLPNRGISYEWKPQAIAGIQIVTYAGVRQMLDLLSTADLVISSKLHIGICTMAFGGCFISVGGRGKVREQLTVLGLADIACLLPDEATEQRFELSLNALDSLTELTTLAIEKVQNDALGHLDILDEELAQLA